MTYPGQEPTQLIISIQGKRGCGKTTLGAHIIEPVMSLIGAKLENKTDKNSGVFLTYQVPRGFAELPLETFTRPMVDEILKGAIAKDRADRGSRICFTNASEMLELLRQRKVLTDFLTAEEDGDMASKIASQALPKELGRVLEPKSVIALLRQDARLKIEEIDLALEKLGFDTSDRPELPDA